MSLGTLLRITNPQNQNMPRLTIKPLTSVSELDETSPNNTFRICWGLYDNISYISFDSSWIRLQFRINVNNVSYRIKFGNTDPTEWSNL